MFKNLAFLLPAVFLANCLYAQTTGAGTLTGTITDPSGAVIPAASVAVKNTATQAERALTTNEAGIYVAQFLQPGAYEIIVTKAGFNKTARTGLTLQVGQTLTVNFSLAVQSSTETMTVDAAAAIVDTEKTEMSQVVSQTQKENLPIAGRRWEGFALLTPNTTTDGGTGLVSYRGISGLYNQSAVDGTSNTQAFFSETKGRTTLGYVYSMDSVQEFQVAASNYSAEMGQAAGGVVNAVTKSGTNATHADLFYYLRYPSLNALDPLQKSRGIYTQPIHQQQQFGGSVGGPIVKDKLFYFLTYEGLRKVNPISYTSTSFNGPQPCLAAIPSATCAAANSFVAAQLGAFPRATQQDVAFAKLDYQFSAGNHVSASLNGLNFKAPNSYRTAATQNNEGPSANGTAVTRERIFVVNWDSVVTPNLTNNFRFQWSRDLEKISENGVAPSVTITNYMNYGLPNALPRPAFPDEHRLQFSDVVSLTHGHHTFKMGADVSPIHELLINLFQGAGVYTYSGANNYSNWVADVAGIDLGDNLTGRHFTTFVQVTDPVTGVGKDDFYNTDVSGFVEDSWKARRNLTLNLGVRYEVQLIPQPDEAQHRDAVDYAVHLDDQHRQEQLRAAHRRGVGGREGNCGSRGIRHFLREDHQQHVLRHARGERCNSADIQLRAHHVPDLEVSEPDLYAPWRDAYRSFRRCPDTGGGDLRAARADPDDARPAAGLGESDGARRRGHGGASAAEKHERVGIVGGEPRVAAAHVLRQQHRSVQHHAGAMT